LTRRKSTLFIPGPHYRKGGAIFLCVTHRRCPANSQALTPEPTIAVAEMIRVTRPGGVVGAYLWDFAGGMQLLRYLWDVAAKLDPAADELDQAKRFPICQPDRLRALFAETGLKAVEVRPLEVPTVFRDFDDYWAPFLAGHGRAPGYVMSLAPDQRSSLRERLQAVLPTRSDGSIRLLARAWAVQGLKLGQELGEAT
jgi:hypothetical protein